MDATTAALLIAGGLIAAFTAQRIIRRMVDRDFCELDGGELEQCTHAGIYAADECPWCRKARVQ